MQVIRFRADLLRNHQFLVELSDWGMLGLIEEEESIRVFFDGYQNLSQLQALYEGSVDTETDPPKAEASPEAVLLGSRFAVITPGQMVPEGREAITMQTTEAFGSGRHETTQLVVEALEEIDLSGCVVLDIGSGSGLVSEAAQRLGALKVFACDIHFGSLQASRHQFPQVASFCGSADAICNQSADVVVANITAPVVDRLADELVRVLKPGGLLLLSGFVFDLVPTRFTPMRTKGRSEWLCWICRCESLLPSEANNAPLQPFAEQWW